jgi:hypothetical protein
MPESFEEHAMPSLDTTNLILGFIAIATLVQSLIVVAAGFWLRRQFSTIVTAASRVNELDFPQLSVRANALLDDVHEIAHAAVRAGHEVERTARTAQGVVHVVGREVERATGGVRLSFDFIEAVARRLFAVVSGLREGARELTAGKGRAVHRIEEGRPVPLAK